MAGLAGIFNAAGLEPASAQVLLDRMAGALAYSKDDLVDRWQDDRLSIARVHHGTVNPEEQPVFGEDKSTLLFMYGQVFGYDSSKSSLIEQGHRFRYKHNDPEYCLNLFQQRGTEAFAELNGSFAIAIYRQDSGDLLLVSDRFSSRPLYYYHDGKHLLFGNQVRPLLMFPGLSRTLDMQSVYDFFTFQRILGNRTYYKRIKTLPPAHVLRIHKGVLSIGCYTGIHYQDEPHSRSYYIERFTEALTNSVAIRTRGTERLGLLLSGGLDSRTVLASSQAGRIPIAFTVADYENREVKIARRIASACNCKHVFLPRDIDHYYRMVDEAVDIGDGMYSFYHAHNLGLFDSIGKEADIMLHCFAYDVLFKAWRLPLRPMQVFKQMYYWPRINISADVTHDGIVQIIKQASLFSLTAQLFKTAVPDITDYINASLESELSGNAAGSSTPELKNLIHYYMFGSAPKFPAYLYVLHHRAYLEERTVAFDNDLLDLAYSIPVGLKAGSALIKDALLRLSPKLAMINNANTGLPASLPVWPELALQMGVNTLHKYLFKPAPQPEPYFTSGSWPNWGELILYNSDLQNLIRDTIEDKKCLDNNIFNIEYTRALFNAHMNRQADYCEPLFLLLTFGRWFKRYGP